MINIQRSTITILSLCLCASVIAEANSPRDGAYHYWSNIAPISELSGSFPSDYGGPILFDSQGNACVMIRDSSTKMLRSNGHDGTWQPPEEVYGRAGTLTSTVIDSNDNITFVFDARGGLEWYILATRYEPGTGWSEPEVVFWTEFFYRISHVSAAVDLHGNVVAVFRTMESRMCYAVYDASSGTWSEVSYVSPTDANFLVLPTLVQNRSGTAIYLAYVVRRPGAAKAIYVHRFDSENREFSPAEVLPDSEHCAFGLATSYTAIPMTVDELGEATLFWEKPSGDTFLLRASRTDQGVWQPPRDMLESPIHTCVEYSGNADVSEYGDVLGMLPIYHEGTYRLCSFRYRAGSGWDEPEFLSNAIDPLTRVSVCFYSGVNAIATFNTSELELASLLYDGTNWGGQVDIPEEWRGQLMEIESDQNEPLLVFQSREGEVGSGVWATWLRTFILGDLDYDGDVDLEDLAQLLAHYGMTSGAVYEDGDLDEDGDVDLADLATLLAYYGEEMP